MKTKCQGGAPRRRVRGRAVNFYDYLPDLDFFGERVLLFMKQAGLRLS